MKVYKTKKMMLAVVTALVFAGALSGLQSCSNDDATLMVDPNDGMQKINDDEVINSIEFREYLSAGLELIKANENIAERIKDINIKELETGVAANGMKYRKLTLQNDVEILTVRLNEKRTVLLSKYPSLKKKLFTERNELINNAICQSKELKDKYPKLKKNNNGVRRLKSPVIEVVYSTCDEIINILNGYMTSKQIEVMAYTFQDGTACYFLCDENTLDICYGYGPSAGGYYNGKKIVAVVHAHDTVTGENYPSPQDEAVMKQYYNQYNIPLGIIYGNTINYYYVK